MSTKKCWLIFWFTYNFISIFFFLSGKSINEPIKVVSKTRLIDRIMTRPLLSLETFPFHLWRHTQKNNYSFDLFSRLDKREYGNRLNTHTNPSLSIWPVLFGRYFRCIFHYNFLSLFWNSIAFLAAGEIAIDTIRFGFLSAETHRKCDNNKNIVYFFRF